MSKIYQTAINCLGLDMAKTQDEYGCAEATNQIFKLAIGKEAGGDLSTRLMYLSLLNDKDFSQVSIPQAGDIVISPTGYGVGTGHVGICGEEGKIMSNNSYTGKWEENYTIFSWKYKFKSFPVVFFRYKEIEECTVVKEENKSLRQVVSQLVEWISSKLSKLK